MKTVKQFLMISAAFFLFSCEESDTIDPITGAQELTGEVTADLVLTDIIDGPGADYYVTGKWYLNANVTVMPGVNIRMEEESSIWVAADGSLHAEGIEENPINIYGNQNTSGYWNEITFDDSSSNSNSLRFVNISDGGGGFQSGMVTLKGLSRVQISHTTLQNSEKYGLYLSTEDPALPGFVSNTIKNCKDFPIGLRATQVHYLDDSSTLTENGDNSYVEVDAGNVKENVTWKNLSVPYLIVSNYCIIESDVIVEPGVRFEMGAESKISVLAEGSLKMIGNTDQRITVTGKVSSPGFYNGIYFENSNNPLNEFQFVDVSYAGPGYGANVWLSGSTRIIIGNSSFNHSANFGIYASRDATLDNLGNNSFAGNAADDIFVQE